jgi:molybdate transport system substrate-binding protein
MIVERLRLAGSRWLGSPAVIVAVLVLLLLLTPTTPAAAEEPALTIAVSANLQYAARELQADFEQRTGARLTLVYGASGNLFAQIQNGAPFDVLLSADMDYPRRLIARHLADEKTLQRYAVGRLVIWVPAESKLDLDSLGIRSVLAPGVEKIAIANPVHAPYGQAAVAVLRHFKLYDQVSSRIVQGESVSQAAQFVESGNAQIGFLPLSLVFAPEVKAKGRYWEVPREAYPSIDQGAVVLAKAPHKDLALKFLEYLKRPATAQLLKRYGFETPPSLGQ